MAFPYKHVLLIGATSGIGKAMADRFIAEGVNVTAVGRRQALLDDFVSSHGSSKASSLTFDIGDLDKIPTFIETALKTYPSIDCVHLNAATVYACDFSQPASVDLASFNHEFSVNFTSYVALTHAVLPHLLARKGNASLVFTGSQVSLVPIFMDPAYSASKAALDAFIMCLREQLHDTNVRVMHISPGPVQTEFHSNYGQPVGECIEEAYAGLVEGTADIFTGCVGGSTKEQVLELAEKKDGAFARMTKLARSLSGS